MNNKIKKYYFLAVIFILGFLTIPCLALAGNVVTNISGDGKIFDADNICPGYTEEHTVTIQNASDPGETVDIYFNFNVTDGSTLADELQLYVIRDGGSYRIGGIGDRMSLEEADDQNQLYVDRLTAGQNKNYKIKVRFSKDAGNSFQNLKTEFNIDFSVTSQTASGPEPLRTGFTGQAPPEEVAGVFTAEEPAETLGGGENPEVLGEENQSPGNQTDWWKWWFWLIILGFLGFFLWLFFRKKAEE